MDDLVRRNDVIDALHGLAHRFEDPEDWCILEGEAEFVVSKLPPAQPEIIHCKDCKYGSPNGKYGCKCYHYRLYDTHEMKPDDYCSRGERKDE